jgi:hypothetical protein
MNILPDIFIIWGQECDSVNEVKQLKHGHMKSTWLYYNVAVLYIGGFQRLLWSEREIKGKQLMTMANKYHIYSNPC